MPTKPVILLFVKAPERGRIKSRLAAALAEDIVVELYRRFVLDMLATVDNTGVPSTICFHPPDAGSEVSKWLGRWRSYLAQQGKDMGERMEQAFRHIFSQGYERAVLIGSDIPDLPANVLTGALDALTGNDAVIGPAEDGGYYLIGFRRETFLPEVFRGMEWSTDQVFKTTRDLLHRAGRTVHQLPPWRDVDTVDDLRDLRMRNAHTDFGKSRTITYLDAIRQKLIAMEGSHAAI